MFAPGTRLFVGPAEEGIVLASPVSGQHQGIAQKRRAALVLASAAGADPWVCPGDLERFRFHFLDFYRAIALKSHAERSEAK